MSVVPSPARGPSALLPLWYLGAATAAFVIAAAGLVWLAPELAGHYYHPRLLALTHTVTLGWITLTIIGASYQLIPIVLERPLWSERLARWQFLLLLAGLGGMIPHFFIAEWFGLAWAAGIVGLALVTHIVNTALTVRGLTRWTFTARLVALALAGLGLTALSGLLLGIDRAWKFLPGELFHNLHAHIHLALLGWVLPMVIGVAARVYPMFLLAREPAGWPGALQCWGLALGVPLVAGGLIADFPPAIAGGAVCVGGAVAGHLVWISGIVRDRKRPQLDWGLRFALAGATFLLPATLAGVSLAFDLVAGPRVALAYLVLAFGWVSLTVAGMLLKIVPFLVWYRAYGGRVGRGQVPTLAELSWAPGELLAFVLLTVGAAALAVTVALGDGSAIRVAAILVAGGAVAFAAVIGHVLAHLARGGPAHLSAAVREGRVS
jgi:hypothetical protein